MKLKIPAVGKKNAEGKRLEIDKTNSTVVAVIAITTVVAVFCLVSTKTLLGQASYQRKVINAKHDAVKQLKANLSAADSLSTQYKVFQDANPNVIGGKNDASPNAVPPDGDNTRVVLNALPSTFDFPALISSVAKILATSQVVIQGVGGTDQASGTGDQATAKPQPAAISLPLSSSGTYAGVQTLVREFELSIRPFDVVSMQLSGSDGSMNITLNINTYYQPATAIKVEKKVLK